MWSTQLCSMKLSFRAMSVTLSSERLINAVSHSVIDRHVVGDRHHCEPVEHAQMHTQACHLCTTLAGPQLRRTTHGPGAHSPLGQQPSGGGLSERKATARTARTPTSAVRS
jgi:hypothetical protein